MAKISLGHVVGPRMRAWAWLTGARIRVLTDIELCSHDGTGRFCIACALMSHVELGLMWPPMQIEHAPNTEPPRGRINNGV
jgi:hypothetical protein